MKVSSLVTVDKKNEIIDKIETPMFDSDIKKYLPKIKIITTQELKKYKSIDDLFNKNKRKESIILLFQSSENSGHWCVLQKYGKIVEFFDSYGCDPYMVYDYAPFENSKKLNIDDKYLCKLLNECNYNVVYNPIQYQEDNTQNMDYNNCGRHCCFRVINLHNKNNFDLPRYFKFMRESKQNFDEPYDVVVTRLINL